MEGNTLYYKDSHNTWQSIDVEQQKSLGKGYWGSGHLACIQDFYNSILEDRSFALELPAVEETVRLMLMIYQSAREKQTVMWEN